MADRPIDFQVRVHVLEARRLAGSGLNPVVKIACGKEMQQTSTQRGTNNPYFDEVSMWCIIHASCMKYFRTTGLVKTSWWLRYIASIEVAGPLCCTDKAN